MIRSNDSFRSNFSPVIRNISARSIMAMVMGVLNRRVFLSMMNPAIIAPMPADRRMSVILLPRRFPTDTRVKPIRKGDKPNLQAVLIEQFMVSSAPTPNPTNPPMRTIMLK